MKTKIIIRHSFLFVSGSYIIKSAICFKLKIFKEFISHKCSILIVTFNKRLFYSLFKSKWYCLQIKLQTRSKLKYYAYFSLMVKPTQIFQVSFQTLSSDRINTIKQGVALPSMLIHNFHPLTIHFLSANC